MWNGSETLFDFKSCFVLFPEAAQLSFVVTELFLAVFAGKAGVGFLGEAFGMSAQGDLPTQQQEKRQSDKAPCMQIWDKDQGGEHHGEIPVVDAAGGAAAVLEQKGLEGTEK